MILLFALAAAAADPAPVERCGYRIVQSYPHDTTSFTQGLFWDGDHLYEGTGQYGRSRVARLDLDTGKALAQTSLPADQFGEGIARWKDQIIGVTWQNGIGHRWSIKDLKPLGNFTYAGEGWGLTTVGDQLVLSDGTSDLRFLDPETMTEQKRVTVRFGGRPISMINELEAIDGQVWANIWMTDFMVRIDPESGDVASLVDLSGLKADAGVSGDDSVLNGIAWDAKKKRLFVTGKYWPKLYEITLSDCR
ncbi:glutaminyl-peptide cyclotransferase [Sphingopyxis macrogoltabida]|uniref:Glutamine cyclotransferase n=1 Tax=Sphingopyxis macrogoltabida TaxID=33050 RepID=A0AAC8Z2C3_SPHMC|nr:glutaminyl-peptide cyclotransferase [Sphingopyxis macrogoltabida]ALJ14356.1 glutamine cyclotransferase [Sphingopyxis macrogoltabida]AMU90623.1 glutamine cyclotransferase [Sphingopyxis macrogoltabida]